MVGALDHAATAIEELVFHPFERNADMRTAVLIKINLALLFDRKELAFAQFKTLAASLGDISKGTETRLIR